MLVAGEVGMAMVHWRWIQPTEIWKVRSCNETVSIQNHDLGGDVFEKKSFLFHHGKRYRVTSYKSRSGIRKKKQHRLSKISWSIPTVTNRYRAYQARNELLYIWLKLLIHKERHNMIVWIFILLDSDIYPQKLYLLSHWIFFEKLLSCLADNRCISPIKKGSFWTSLGSRASLRWLCPPAAAGTRREWLRSADLLVGRYDLWWRCGTPNSQDSKRGKLGGWWFDFGGNELGKVDR